MTSENLTGALKSLFAGKAVEVFKGGTPEATAAIRTLKNDKLVDVVTRTPGRIRSAFLKNIGHEVTSMLQETDSIEELLKIVQATLALEIRKFEKSESESLGGDILQIVGNDGIRVIVTIDEAFLDEYRNILPGIDHGAKLLKKQGNTAMLATSDFIGHPHHALGIDVIIEWSIGKSAYTKPPESKKAYHDILEPLFDQVGLSLTERILRISKQANIQERDAKTGLQNHLPYGFFIQDVIENNEPHTEYHLSIPEQTHPLLALDPEHGRDFVIQALARQLHATSSESSFALNGGIFSFVAFGDKESEDLQKILSAFREQGIIIDIKEYRKISE